MALGKSVTSYLVRGNSQFVITDLPCFTIKEFLFAT
jgi:hypothetical protein